jgi:hypothetical protein
VFLSIWNHLLALSLNHDVQMLADLTGSVDLCSFGVEAKTHRLNQLDHLGLLGEFK